MSKVKDLGTATLTVEGNSIELPLFEGSEKEKAVEEQKKHHRHKA